MAAEAGLISDPRSLLGDWELSRRVVDRLTGRGGTASGVLTLHDDGSLIRWQERATLRWAGADLPVTRELLLTQARDGWHVRFPDGRPFHPWRPGEIVEHYCNADVYRGLIDARQDRLRILWDIRGPAKDQRILTRCRRR